MDCARFAEQIEDLVSSRGGTEEAATHAEECDRCAALLRRARRIAALIEKRPEVEPPVTLSARVRSAAFGSRPRRLASLARVAAAVVMFAACGLLVFSAFSDNGTNVLSPGPDYEPLNVRVVLVNGNGALEESFALEGLYGPDATMLLADAGESDNDNGR